MKFPKRRLFNKRIQLNKAFFTRSHVRDHESDDIFINASTSLTAFGKIALQILVTPIVAATSALTASIALMIANVCMTLGYLVEFIYSLSRREVAKVDSVLTVVLMIAAISLSLYISPIVLSSSMTMLMVWAAASQIATAINVSFVVGKFIIPPLKRFIEWGAFCFGFDIRQLYYYKKPLNLEDDKFIIEHLLEGRLTKKNEKKLESYNHLLRTLCQYTSKYQEKMFGSIISEKKINKMKEYTDNLIKDGKLEGLVYIRKKISYKLTKIRDITDAMTELDTAFDQQDVKVFKRLGLGFFDNNSLQQLQATYRQAYHALNAERDRQEKKAVALIRCLPKEDEAGRKLTHLKQALGLDPETTPNEHLHYRVRI